MPDSVAGFASPDDFYPDAPLRLVSFYLPLPAPILTPGESTLTVDLGEPGPQVEGLDLRIVDEGPSMPNPGNRFVSIRLLQAQAEVDIWGMPSGQFMDIVLDKNPDLGRRDGQAQEDGFVAPKSAVTVAECVTTLKAGLDDPVSEAFDRCLEAMAELARAHRLMYRLATPVVSYESLPMMLPYVLRAVESPGVPPHYMLGVFLLHDRAPYGVTAQEVSSRDMERLMVYFGSLRESHPGIPYSELRLESRLALQRDGAYRQSVVLAYTAVEVLLDTVLALMLWEEGADAADAAAVVFSGYASGRVVREFHPRVGGHWEASGGGPVSQFLRVLAPLRHRTVHLGYSPTQDEAATAQAIATSMDDLVAERLIANKSKYKTTACLFFGLRWLEEHGHLSRRIRRHVESSDVESWLPAFNSWYAAVVDEITRARGSNERERPCLTRASSRTPRLAWYARLGRHRKARRR